MELIFQYESEGLPKTLVQQVKETNLTFNFSVLQSWGTIAEPTWLDWQELNGVKYITQRRRSAGAEIEPYTKFIFLPTSVNTALAPLADWTDTTYQMVLQSGMDNFVRDEFKFSSYKVVHCGEGMVNINFGLTTIHEGETDIPAYVNSGIAGLNPTQYPEGGMIPQTLIQASSSEGYGVLNDNYSRRPNLMFLHVTIHDDVVSSGTYGEDFDVIAVLRSEYDVTPPTCYSKICFIDKRLFGESEPMPEKPTKSTTQGNTPNGFRGGRDDYSDTDTISTISDQISTSANTCLHGLHFYHMDATEFEAFTEAMWSDDTWAQFSSRGDWNPVGGVLSLAYMPCDPDNYSAAHGTYTNIRSSGKELLLNDAPVQAFAPDTTTAELVTPTPVKPLEYSHSFLDWSGYTKAHVRLPWIGIVPIDISKIMNGGLIVKYNIDFITGNCLAQLYAIPEQEVMGDRTNDDEYGNGVVGCCIMIGQYAGNCAHKLPYSGASIGGSNVIGSITTSLLGGVTAVAGAFMQNPAMIAGGVGTVITNGTKLIMPDTHPMTQNATPNADSMGMLVPALIIERPMDLTPLNGNDDATVYEYFNGRPAAGGGTVKDYKSLDTGEGIFIKGILHADTLYATEDEKRQIESAFAKGVYL